MTNFDRQLIIDSIDIMEPAKLSELIAEIFGTTSRSYGFRLAQLSTPLFIYKEKLIRYENGIVGRESRIEYHIANEKGDGSAQFSIERNVLSLRGRSISENRGNILVAFCKIEFIVDALLFHLHGIYEGKTNYKAFYKKLMKNNGSSFHSFENKKNYIFLHNFIKKDTYELLTKVQKIRNKIAHQLFLESSIGLEDADLEGQNSQLEAVEYIFNYCWLLVLRDYNPHQVAILNAINCARAD